MIHKAKKKHTTQRQRFPSSMLSITTRRCEWNFHWKAITACIAPRFHKTQAANASIIASTRKRKKIWSLPRLYLCLRSARFHDEISALVLAFILASCLRCWWKPGLSQISTRQINEARTYIAFTIHADWLAYTVNIEKILSGMRLWRYNAVANKRDWDKDILSEPISLLFKYTEFLKNWALRWHSDVQQRKGGNLSSKSKLCSLELQPSLVNGTAIAVNIWSGILDLE